MEPGKSYYLLFHNTAFLFGTKTVNVNVQLQSAEAASYKIESESMAPALHIGDVIVLDKNTNFESIKVGDIIVFRAVDPTKENKTIVSGVIKIFQPGERLAGDPIFNGLCDQMPLPSTAPDKEIMTKGDANDCSIPLEDFPITQKNYVGKVAYTIPSFNQSNNSNNDNESYRYVRQWGSEGSGNGEFNKPLDIAIDSHDNVYVADAQNGRIQKFNSSGNFITQWNAAGSGVPQGIAVDSHDNVYITDTNNNQVQKFDSNGNFIMAWGYDASGEMLFENPQGIAIDSSDDVYVTDIGLNLIQKFDSNGAFLSNWGSEGSGNGQFNGPSGIAADSNGNVYVTDSGNNRIQKFENNGNFIMTWGSKGTDNGQLLMPAGIAVEPHGNVYVVDLGNDRIQVFAPVD